MKRSNIVLGLSIVALAAFIFGSLGTSGNILAGDTSEPDYCAVCHFSEEMTAVQTQIVEEWKDSSHGNSYFSRAGNTYCAKCHSPFQADPDASYGSNEPVPLDDWQGVTCQSCHPPLSVRSGWGTPIGTYDVATGEYAPVYEDDRNALCENCHQGSRHASVFEPGPGKLMDKKGVQCVDCHMPEIPTEGTDREHRSHSWHILESTDNPEYSCGMERAECHSEKDADWASKQLEKSKIHNVGWDTDAQHPWQDNQGQTKDK